MSYFKGVKITFLGTGASSGTPVPGCDCRVCRSKNPRDRRLRPALLLEWNGRHVLIDTPPELRLQLLSTKVRKIDAILFTHCHADHVYGLDDVRIFSRERKIPVFGDARTLAELKRIFPYVFKRTQKAGGKPRLRLKAVETPFRLFGSKITPLPVYHGNRSIRGFRLDGFAYIPDCSRIPEKTYGMLTGLNVLALDALRETPHPTHFSLSESLQAAARIGAKRTWLTHISHAMGYTAMRSKLSATVDAAYDGLTIRAG